MDFKSIYNKFNALEESKQLAECPDAETQQAVAPASVNMNVTMNAQGPEGIRDLISVLRNIESGDGEDAEQELVSVPGELGDLDDIEIDTNRGVIDDSYSNSADRTVTMGVDSVTATGDDMHSKGGPEPKKPAGGGNPYRAVDEGLVRRLGNLYSEIKGR